MCDRRIAITLHQAPAFSTACHPQSAFRAQQHTPISAHAELLKKQKPASLARELILGFKPVQLYLESLQSRFRDVATICAGFQGGAMVGIKWRLMVCAYQAAAMLVIHHTASKWGMAYVNYRATPYFICRYSSHMS